MELSNLLRRLRKVHCILCDKSTATNYAYWIQNLVEISSCFVTIVTHMYMIFVLILDLMVAWPGKPKARVILMFLLYSGTLVIRLLSIACGSEGVVLEASRTERLVGKLLLLLPLPGESSCQEPLQQFREQLARSRLGYNAAGFFSLNASPLKSLLPAVTTYLVIRCSPASLMPRSSTTKLVNSVLKKEMN
ncbi:putative gustatory receptor 28b [Schistocerca piceifrons]|uniref:putative gustatory receptor 28b n=1 Tax=Schistocerca piceifrons TaxID=274613 RepID=UPI001F5E6D68|nr:putative gustatory receptor 28b [Schistocerca piceifrons]